MATILSVFLSEKEVMQLVAKFILLLYLFLLSERKLLFWSFTLRHKINVSFYKSIFLNLIKGEGLGHHLRVG